MLLNKIALGFVHFRKNINILIWGIRFLFRLSLTFTLKQVYL